MHATAYPAVRSIRRADAVAMEPVIDPAEWTGKTLEQRDDWVYALGKRDIDEIEAAIASAESARVEIKDIGLEDFPLPTLDAVLADVRAQLMDGLGIALIRGLPVERWGIRRSAIAYWGIGLRTGVPVSQNAKGHLLGHVADLVGSSREAANVRGYQTSADMDYHTDSCDIVALLCMRKAQSGGASAVASTVAVYNEMLRRRPDLVSELVEPWYRDRRGEVPPGKQEWFELPVFNFQDGYFLCNWQSYYIRSAQRFEQLPRFTDRQTEALDTMSALAHELRSEMAFEPGDIQFLHNHVTVHARTAFVDWPEPERRRHLLRLWLSTPGGRPLPQAFYERYGTLVEGDRPAGIECAGTVLSTPLEPS